MFKTTITLLAIVNKLMVPVPLDNIRYDVEINGGVANVKLTQKYTNNFDADINTVFNFPVSDKAVFDRLTARFRETTVFGVVKEKEEAKKQFEEEKKKGNTVILVEADKAMDIFTASLGNLPRFETVEISLFFIMPLEVVDMTNWELIIPSTLSPRYTPNDAEKRSGLDRNTGVITYTSDKNYNWNIFVNVRWPGEVGGCLSTSHSEDLIFEQTTPRDIAIRFNPNKAQFPTKDFHLIIKDKDLFKDSSKVTQAKMNLLPGHLPQYAAVMQFIPSLYSRLLGKTAKPTRQEVINFSKENTQNEFIFIVDRSGSMSGGRIKIVRDVFADLIGQLPETSLFNIISFGSRFDSMFSSSVPLNRNNKETAANKISRFDADYGGTEILEPLESLRATNSKEGYGRVIILLTDGEVSNTEQVIREVRRQNLMSNTKVMCIGIGNGVSQMLVNGLAEAGQGKAIYIEDSTSKELVATKITSLVEDAITPFLNGFDIKFDPKYVAALAPMLGPNNQISPNQPFMVYALLSNNILEAPNKSTTVSISFYDPVIKERTTKYFLLSAAEPTVDNSLHKLAVYHVLRAEEYELKQYHLGELLRTRNFQVDLSVAYQVMSPKYTSFICLVARRVTQGPAIDVDIPSMDSKDYDFKTVNPAADTPSPYPNPSPSPRPRHGLLNQISMLLVLLMSIWCLLWI